MAERRRACASCGTANEEDARFCEGCGAALARVCGACGVAASAAARFCRACGAPIAEQLIPTPAPTAPAAGPARKTVTVIFADLAGSTGFEEQVDAETARAVISRYHDLLRSTAQHHRAGVTKYIGDGFMAVWGVPEMGPDDADHAVDAAVDLQEHFVDLAAGVSEAHGVDLALRVAVNTGELVVGAHDADLVGDAVNVAARLESECPIGHVVVGEQTWRSTRGRHRYESLGRVQVKGRTAPVAVYRWLARQTEATDAAPFVGRTDELRQLQAALDDVVVAQAARVVTVIGDPGLGKSRLAAEFVGSLHDTRVIRARCDVEQTVALAPIVEVLRARDLDADLPVGVGERDRMLRDLHGLTAGVPGSVEETFWALRRYVEVLAGGGPLVLVIDDIHWADTLLLDFIEHLAEWVSAAPILVVALARPELREVRTDLGTVSRWVTAAVHLGGLDADATAELAAGVLGAARLPAELSARLPSSTGGNPLFVRELVGMLVHDGVLVAEPTGWRLTIDADAIAIPPTIHALLASRLERLAPAERRVLEIASVVGTDFSLGAVTALAERDAPEVKGSLDRLRRLDLAQPSGAYLGDEPVWRFHHVLIRDVAYRRLLKSDRADLHERLADWVAAGGASGAFDTDEMLARHLDAAHGYRVELGISDAHTGELAVRAARCYLASARRALDRDELTSAGTQAARGAALAGADNTLHAELLLIGCEALLSAGDVAAAAPLVDDLDRIADDVLAPWASCYRCQFVVYTDPAQLLEVDTRLQHAIDEFGRRADPLGLAKAHRVRASARGRLGRIGDCEVDLFEALVAARQGGDHRQITVALSAAPSAALWGPSPVPKAGGRCLDVVRMQRMTVAAPSLEATSLRCLAVLELLRGRPDKARSMLADARQIVADLGLRHGLMETELFAGIIELMQGDPVAAEPHFRTALSGLDALGVGADAGQAAALLARSVLAQGRIDEADRYAAESEQLAGHNLKTAIAWRAVRAEILAARGRHDEAAAIGRDAVAVAAGTDLVLDHAEACLALGRVLDAAGDEPGAVAARRDAAALYAAKAVASAIGQTGEPAASTAPTPAPAATSRLAVSNRASQTADDLQRAMQAHDVDAAVAVYLDRFVYDDHRGFSGDPIEDLAEMRRAFERNFGQFTAFEGITLAVRGERLELRSSHFSDDAGNETTSLSVLELADDCRIAYHGRFDEDDFEGAYRELERRYYAGEGAACAESGATLTAVVVAGNRGDLDTVFGEFVAPGLRFESRSSSVFPDRSAAELHASSAELSAMVAAVRFWYSAVCWLSPNLFVARQDREALGRDGEKYAWTRLYAGELRDGLVTALCDFDVEDEDSAFAYAEERMRATSARLAMANRASETVDAGWLAMQAHGVDTVVAKYADRFVYDDRRQLSGDPIEGIAGLRAGLERIIEQYPHVEWRTLAVRGERLDLRWSRWFDDAGNETTSLHLFEFGDDGLVGYQGRFDEHGFVGAYRELERRYYAGEGAEYAVNGQVVVEFMAAINRLDVDAARRISLPDWRLRAPPTTLADQDRSVDDMFRWLDARARQVSSVTNWFAVVRWLSPTCLVGRINIRAIGQDGEEFAWSRVYVIEFLDGRMAAVCQFDDDEEAAFGYAENLIAAPPTRLAVDNRASEVVGNLGRTMQARDIDATLAGFSDEFVYDDHRRLSGDPITDLTGMRVAIDRIFKQYSHFEARVLAVRGERLTLGWSRWSDDAGNETDYLHLFEVGDDGRVTYDGRFDEDDFEGAYRELDRRYYAGEGATYAESGAVQTESILALNRGDFDRFFDEFSTPDMRVENRSRSGFPDRSASDLRASFAELNAMVASARTWLSAMCWVSPACCVTRLEREAVGPEGERYAWTRILVGEVRDGRMASMCEFEPDHEEAAFGYAEQRPT